MNTPSSSLGDSRLLEDALRHDRYAAAASQLGDVQPTLVRLLKPLILLVPKTVLLSLKMKTYVKLLNKSNWQIINMKFQPLV